MEIKSAERDAVHIKSQLREGPTNLSASNLTTLPPIFVFSVRLTEDELHEMEEELQQRGAPLTYSLDEAKLFVGRIGTKRRAELELRTHGVWTEELSGDENDQSVQSGNAASQSGGKRGRSWGTRKDSQDSVKSMRLSQWQKVPDPESETEFESESETEAEEDVKNEIDLERGRDLGLKQDSESSGSSYTLGGHQGSSNGHPCFVNLVSDDTLVVLNWTWLEDSFRDGCLKDPAKYTIYRARRVTKGASFDKPYESAIMQADIPQTIKLAYPPVETNVGYEILHRAKLEAEKEGQNSESSPSLTPGPRRFRKGGLRHSNDSNSHYMPEKVKLLEQNTSDYEEGPNHDLPETPAWVKEHRLYSCERSTPLDSPNAAFIEELKKIRLARILTEDEIGVRAYSTSIASIAAYPYKITQAREILALPGCEVKLANLWIEWVNHDGIIEAVKEVEGDSMMSSLRLFYNIWGVGATTAREFYNRGWRDLEDIVEFGWDTLTRVQQIGVKFYDEFQEAIPRAEVKDIGRVVREAAVRVRGEGIETCIVGGYRRGKEGSGDVDIIVSHRRLEATANLIADVVAELEKSGHITHTLLLANTQTNREQATLPFRQGGRGHGFDSLDKALVVWQDPVPLSAFVDTDGYSNDQAENESPNSSSQQSSVTVTAPSSLPRQQPRIRQTPHENPGNYEVDDDADGNKNDEIDVVDDTPTRTKSRPHRRVDIIISPWRTVGCALLGWSGGNTFQRDIRRYARAAKGWKFDSSGIRDRATGMVVDLEGEGGEREIDGGVRGSMDDAERKVFDGLGLVYREPWERCTG